MQAVAFLRGINVGTAKRVPMSELRRVAEDLGYGDVRTILNSGNVVFSMIGTDVRAAASRLEAAVARRFGVTSATTVVPLDDLAALVRREPFDGIASNPSRLLLLICRDATAVARVKALARRAWGDERLSVRGGFGCAWCPNGIASSPLWTAINAEVGDGVTARNRATVARVVMLHGSTDVD